MFILRNSRNIWLNPKICTNVQLFGPPCIGNRPTKIRWTRLVYPIHTTKLSCLCRVCLGRVNWILDNSKLSPTENLKSERAAEQLSNSHRHTRHDKDRTVLSCLLWRCELSLKPCSQQTKWTELQFTNWSSEHMLSDAAVHSSRTEVNWTAPSWPSYTTRYWSHASASRSWLAAVCELLSSAQFICCGQGFRVTHKNTHNNSWCFTCLLSSKKRQNKTIHQHTHTTLRKKSMKCSYEGLYKNITSFGL